jgi:hypothetical protein
LLVAIVFGLGTAFTGLAEAQLNTYINEAVVSGQRDDMGAGSRSNASDRVHADSIPKTLTAVPEPSQWPAVIALGLVALVIFRRRHVRG